LLVVVEVGAAEAVAGAGHAEAVECRPRPAVRPPWAAEPQHDPRLAPRAVRHVRAQVQVRQLGLARALARQPGLAQVQQRGRALVQVQQLDLARAQAARDRELVRADPARMSERVPGLPPAS
jgi:hypothetical protein